LRPQFNRQLTICKGLYLSAECDDNDRKIVDKNTWENFFNCCFLLKMSNLILPLQDNNQGDQKIWAKVAQSLERVAKTFAKPKNA
jgi:hypothetical protein